MTGIDLKLTAHTELTTIADEDLFYVVHDPSGTPLWRKITRSNLLKTMDINLKAATELTIAAGAITITQSAHKLQPESGTTGVLSTISGMAAGEVAFLIVSDKGTDTITVEHGTGNISCVGEADIVLSNGMIVCYSDGTTVYVSGGGGGGGAWGSITGTLSDQTDLQTILSTGWIPASGTWTFSSADAPTYIVSINADMTGIISVGMKIKLTHATVKYFIVTAVGAFSGGNTLITLYGGTDYTLAAAGDAITSPYYSTAKIPFGFPAAINKWTITVVDTTGRSQAAGTVGTWYNIGSISITVPIGVWSLSYACSVDLAGASAGNRNVLSTLSTSNNSESHAVLTSYPGSVDQSVQYFGGFVNKVAQIVMASKTTFYLLWKNSVSADTIDLPNSTKGSCLLMAVCAYL